MGATSRFSALVYRGVRPRRGRRVLNEGSIFIVEIPPTISNAPTDPNAPTDSSTVPNAHNLPNSHTISNLPTVPNAHTIPNSSTVPNAHNLPNSHIVPNSPIIPNPTTVPNPPTLPNPTTVPNSPTILNSSTVPKAPNLPNSLTIPNSPTVPNTPIIPNSSTVPNTHNLPTSPTVPNALTVQNPSTVPNAHTVPNPSTVPNAPTIPNLPLYNADCIILLTHKSCILHITKMNPTFQFDAISSSSYSLSDNEEDIQFFENLQNRSNAILTIISREQNLVASYIIQQEEEVTHGGSIPGNIFIRRDREIADRKLFNDYFAENPVYNEAMFRRRFRMSRNLFLRIVDGIQNHDVYLIQRSDSLGRLGLSTNQKATAALRMLAYALPADATDEYIQIGESTAIQCMQRFCRAIVEVFAKQYLRSPAANDVARLLYIGKQRGFPGILFYNLAQGIAPPAHYNIGSNEYDTGYYLADSIYPKWSTIVQTIHDPRGLKKQYFAMKQESCRKDVERAFGVLRSRFAIVASPARGWKKNHLHDIMKACIIMHNMIIEDERDLSEPIQDAREAPTPVLEIVVNEHIRFQEFLARYKKIKDKDAYFALRNSLIDHLWDEYGHSNI
ncbi:uncharacterized protein [Primulina huaijiensis]|uniref:uncharacterized protein n=1 Tax=Primulina huaijiensis TaxID=1492673 RepID=UPI003CC6ECFF